MTTTNKIFLAIIVLVFALFGCELDNYDQPETHFYGSIVNSTNGEPIPGKQPNGARVRLFEVGFENVQPIDFWVKQNGEFSNSRLFPAEYKVIAEGPFYPLDTLTVDLQSDREFNIEATPFTSIDLSSVDPSGNSVTVTYTISRSRDDRKILEMAVLISDKPFVDNNSYINSDPYEDVSGTDDEDLLGTPFQETVSDLESGKEYFVRVAVRSENPAAQFNYSQIVSFTTD